MQTRTIPMRDSLPSWLTAKSLRLKTFCPPLNPYLSTLARTHVNRPIFSNLQPIGMGIDPPPHRRGSNFQTVLNPKLPQMMVQMLIHQCRPFDRSERPEKEVRMLRAVRRPAHHKAINRFPQPLLFDGEIAFFGYQAAFLGHRIAAHWLPLHQQRLLHQRPEQTSKEDSRRCGWLPHCQVHGRRAMGQRLRWIHFAPLALAIRLQPRQPLFHFFHPCRLKEIFHVKRRPPIGESNRGDANRQPRRKIFIVGADGITGWE
jgi:hypothetical protein